jgi:hypothetical protein
VVRVFDVSKVHIATIMRVDSKNVLVYIKISGPAEPGDVMGRGRAGAVSGRRKTSINLHLLPLWVSCTRSLYNQTLASFNKPTGAEI